MYAPCTHGSPPRLCVFHRPLAAFFFLQHSFGADRVRLVLSDTAALLDSLVDQTLTAMEAGLSLDRVLQAVRLPTDLLSVRGIWKGLFLESLEWIPG